MASGAITDEQITASSEHSANHAAIQSRLYFKVVFKAGAWSAGKKDHNQWLQVDLIGQYRLTRVATQGRKDDNEWVKKYKLKYSNDTSSFQYFKELAQNNDKVKLICR